MKSIQTWRLNIKIANEANSSEHWAIKAKRHKKQKQFIKRAFLADRPLIQLPCTVTLTRIDSHELDEHDNLPISFKWVVDAIADWFFPGKAAGRADDTDQIKWKYRQEKGSMPHEYGLRIEMSKDD